MFKTILDWSQDLMIQSPNKTYSVNIEFPLLLDTYHIFIDGKSVKISESIVEMICLWQHEKLVKREEMLMNMTAFSSQENMEILKNLQNYSNNVSIMIAQELNLK